MEVSRIELDSESRAEFRNTEGDYFSFKKKLTEWPQRLGLESAADFTLPETPGNMEFPVRRLVNRVRPRGKGCVSACDGA